MTSLRFQNNNCNFPLWLNKVLCIKIQILYSPSLTNKGNVLYSVTTTAAKTILKQLFRKKWKHLAFSAGSHLAQMNDRADRLAGKVTLTSGLLLGRSEALRSLRHYLRAQSQGQHTIDRLERGVERARRSSFKGRERAIVNQTYIVTVSKATTLGKLLREGVEHLWAFPSAHILSWAKENWTELAQANLPKNITFISGPKDFLPGIIPLRTCKIGVQGSTACVKLIGFTRSSLWLPKKSHILRPAATWLSFISVWYSSAMSPVSTTNRQHLHH